MINVIINGILGKMGCLIRERITKEEEINCIAGIDITAKDEDIPIVVNLEETIENTDIVVDFSLAPATMESIPLCEKYKKGMVIGTTGFSNEEIKRIKAAGEKIPILLSSNMSIGVNLLYKLVAQAAGIFKSGYDIEIIEKHHRYKKDSPSGTAVTTGKIIAEKLSKSPDETFKYGRKGFDKRKEGEITFHSVRGGKIIGDHEILFIGDNEIFKISHAAISREIFVDGTIMGIKFIAGKKSGFYTMEDVIKS